MNNQFNIEVSAVRRTGKRLMKVVRALWVIAFLFTLVQPWVATCLRAQAMTRPVPPGPQTNAVVWTGQPDYAPGTSALIFGKNFQPGESVTLQVVQADSSTRHGRCVPTLER